MDKRKLIEMSVDAARAAKWTAGVIKYGVEFVGNPVMELHDEAIDCLNYIDEISKQELANEYELLDLRYHAERIIEITRLVHGKNTSSG